MRFFLEIEEYLFVYVFKLYQRWGEKDIAGVHAVCVITFFQILNLATLAIIAIEFYLLEAATVQQYHGLIVCLVLLAFNFWYIYSFKGKFALLQAYGEAGRSSVGRRTLLYTITTVVTFLIVFVRYLSV